MNEMTRAYLGMLNKPLHCAMGKQNAILLHIRDM